MFHVKRYYLELFFGILTVTSIKSSASFDLYLASIPNLSKTCLIVFIYNFEFIILLRILFFPSLPISLIILSSLSIKSSVSLTFNSSVPLNLIFLIVIQKLVVLT